MLITQQDSVKCAHRDVLNVPQKTHAQLVKTATNSLIQECAKAVMMVASPVPIISAPSVTKDFTLISSINVKKTVEKRCLLTMKLRDAENVLRDVLPVSH